MLDNVSCSQQHQTVTEEEKNLSNLLYPVLYKLGVRYMSEIIHNDSFDWLDSREVIYEFPLSAGTLNNSC